jgi:HK97 gp10 family phage protein
MKEFSNIESFVGHLTTLAAAEVLVARKALDKCASIVEKRAKDKIGEYQAQVGPFIAWQELADSTKADRESKGFPENEPLLRTGDMRDSISHALSTSGLEAQIGSDSDIAVYQELGTSKMPPRSFLGGAMVESLPEIKTILADSLVGMLTVTNVEAALLGDGVVPGGIKI